LVGTYHLFAAITRERIEPEVETFDGARWTERELRHKPGALDRRPDFVAPHQPRLDFQLWFYGLDYQRSTPTYIVNLLDRVCSDPQAVAGFFARPLDPHPKSVRLIFWEYRFATLAEHRATGAWWLRTRKDESRPMNCQG
ncbi:MAG: lipase maturation factor family protein, partial [Polyangia bacterium]